MADWFGACAAIKAMFTSQWVSGSVRRTPIAFQNETPNDGASPPVTITPWPPIDENGSPVPWVYFEVEGNSGDLRGAGLPGDNVFLDQGHIIIHVFVPKDYGVDEQGQLAIAAGNIFRARTLYQDGAGAKVVCKSPSPPREGAVATYPNSGNQYGVTVTVPFEFFYRG
nr:MAG TPA: hypothetical protein [Caudoviricetes sp.]